MAPEPVPDIELISDFPSTHPLASEILSSGHAGIGIADQHRSRPLQQLGNVHHITPLASQIQRVG